jgi:tetratricopeptide (TPR) repeat protein
MTTSCFKYFRAGLAVGLIALHSSTAIPAETNPTNAVNAKAAEGASQETLRSYSLIQEQLRNTQATIDRDRQDTEAAQARNAEALETRLNAIEKLLAAQRARELETVQNSLQTMQSSSRFVLVAAGVFALIGFLVLLFTGFQQFIAVNRLAKVAAALPAGRALGAGNLPAALGLGGGQWMGFDPVEQSSARFLEIIGRLEKRIQDMEQATQARPPLPEPAAPNGDPAANAAHSHSDAAAVEHGAEPVGSETAAKIVMLLGKGQTLLRLDQAENALACFEAALELEPDNAEALIKKGGALERLQRLDEALACYDRVIAGDSSKTMAYLYKGGVFNRMERYSEALECYEQALRTQEKSHAA